MAVTRSKTFAGTVALGFVMGITTDLTINTSMSGMVLSTPYTVATSAFTELSPFFTLTTPVRITGQESSVITSSLMDVATGVSTADEIWKTIDAFWGVWNHLDEHEVNDWFDSLRDSSNTRLSEIYGDEWE